MCWQIYLDILWCFDIIFKFFIDLSKEGCFSSCSSKRKEDMTTLILEGIDVNWKNTLQFNHILIIYDIEWREGTVTHTWSVHMHVST